MEGKEKDHHLIFQTFTEYQHHIQNREEPSMVGNETYLIKDDVLYKTIDNHWGEKIQVEVPTLQDAAKEFICKIDTKLGHLGLRQC